MELKDFIATTLKEIYAGIDEAKGTTQKHFQIWPTTQRDGGIKFDLAVTSSSTTESTSTKGGGLKVKVISAEIEKGKSASYSAETTSRIVFSVNP